jgi:hypothetical protein
MAPKQPSDLLACLGYRGLACPQACWLWKQHNEGVQRRDETTAEAGCPSGPIVNHHQLLGACTNSAAASGLESSAMRQRGCKGGRRAAAAQPPCPANPPRNMSYVERPRRRADGAQRRGRRQREGQKAGWVWGGSGEGVGRERGGSREGARCAAKRQQVGT